MYQTISMQGSLYGQTVKITLGASALLTTKVDTALVAAGTTAVAEWGRIKAVLLTCEDYDARIAFGVAAANGGTPMGHILAVGQSLRLTSKSIIESAYLIDKTSGSHANLMVTLEY